MNIYERFMTSKYKKMMFNYDSEVAAIVISGSRMIGVNDENSDYDINVLIVNKKSLVDFPLVVLDENGEKIHWYYNNINNILNGNIEYNYLTYVFLIELGWFEKSKIAYLNPKYENLIDLLEANKHTIAEKAAVTFLKDEFNYNHISKLASQTKVKFADYTKLLYRYAFVHLLLFNSDTEFTKRLRSIDTNPLTDEESNKMIQICKDLKEYVDRRKENA